MRQFTATVYIIDGQNVLLIFHKKLQKWLPPGGHMEPDELPIETAVREAKEETGLDVEIFSEENIWIEPRWNARSFERPYMCLLEEIPAKGNEPAHQHIDFIYVGRPSSRTMRPNNQEIDKLKWFSLQELQDLELDIEIFEETFRTIEHLLTSERFALAL